MWLMTVALARDPDLVLVSMDTVRADVVSCYGVPPGPYRTPTTVTPTIDALAADGVRYTAFFAHAPSTLSSHLSMMSGRDPHQHGVPRNGYPVPDQIPLLAESLARAGYDTMAVVGAGVLGGGLARGFRIYDLPTAPERPADEVVGRVLAAVAARPDPERPLFLFVHFYDAHAPYAPPPAFDRFADPSLPAAPIAEGPAFHDLVQRVRRRQAAPAEIARVASLYLGEVASVDHAIGTLIDGLRAQRLLSEGRRGLLVVTADHGESLGDQPAYVWSHGSNVDYEVMRVPLVIHGLPSSTEGVIARAAGMSDLAPSLLRWLGIDDPLGNGVPLDTPGDRPVFFEATRPRQFEDPQRWNNLPLHRGVWVGDRGGYYAPFWNVPFTLFSESAPADPASLAALVARWDENVPPHAVPLDDPRATAALRALGYLD